MLKGVNYIIILTNVLFVTITHSVLILFNITDEPFAVNSNFVYDIPSCKNAPVTIIGLLANPIIVLDKPICVPSDNT